MPIEPTPHLRRRLGGSEISNMADLARITEHNAVFESKTYINEHVILNIPPTNGSEGSGSKLRKVMAKSESVTAICLVNILKNS